MSRIMGVYMGAFLGDRIRTYLRFGKVARCERCDRAFPPDFATIKSREKKIYAYPFWVSTKGATGPCRDRVSFLCVDCWGGVWDRFQNYSTNGKSNLLEVKVERLEYAERAFKKDDDWVYVQSAVIALTNEEFAQISGPVCWRCFQAVKAYVIGQDQHKYCHTCALAVWGGNPGFVVGGVEVSEELPPVPDGFVKSVLADLAEVGTVNG